MAEADFFMERCFDLARLGAGRVSPNPMVGAVLVYQNTIIGEGFHQAYGKAHAEVHAVQSVPERWRLFIPESTLYVSLEPCCIFGKTPPCTDLIQREGIKKVVISTLDETPEVKGRSVNLLRKAGIEVVTGVLEEKGKELVAARSTFVQYNRPYILLKYAVSREGFFAPDPARPYWLTNPFSKRLTHRWRSESDAILVGTTTALVDNPRLDNRYYFGSSPLRVVLDPEHRIPETHALKDGTHASLIICAEKPALKSKPNVEYLELPFDEHLLGNLMHKLYRRNIGSLLVEGGARLLHSFIQQQLWDEARVLVGAQPLLTGTPAPHLPVSPIATYPLGDNQLLWYKNVKTILPSHSHSLN